MSDDERGSEDFFRSRGFGMRIGFGARPAVLSIDIINAFTDPGMPLGSDLSAEIAAARSVLDAARTAGVPIVHTTVAYQDGGLADAGIWALKQAGLATLRAGTREVEVDERLGARPGEQVLAKKYASVFFGTDLVPGLVSRGIDTLIMVGCTTSGCVRASAVDAVQNGFRPMVVREAVGDRSPQAHEQALFDLEQKYADVVSLEETVAYLAGQGTVAS
ncbi:MAG: isochorismatase family protein [Candidatus Leucobacter sulfamidivorax]|nr:isochorismatase family protein [Candidatus Leucobacter sulfamidivorax]